MILQLRHGECSIQKKCGFNIILLRLLLRQIPGPGLLYYLYCEYIILCRSEEFIPIREEGLTFFTYHLRTKNGEMFVIKDHNALAAFVFLDTLIITSFPVLLESLALMVSGRVHRCQLGTVTKRVVRQSTSHRLMKTSSVADVTC